MSDLGNDPTQVNVPAVGGPPPPAGPRGPRAGDPAGAGGEDGTGGPQDRRLYIAIAALLVVIVIGLGFFVLRDDGDDNAAPGDTTTVVVDETTTTTISTTTTTVPPTVTTSPPPEPTAPTVTSPATTVPIPPGTTDPAQCRESGSSPDDPELPARVVFVAWTRTDVLCAQELMTSGAYDILFGRDGTDAQDQFQGCTEVDEGDPHFDCAFSYEGGATHYLMNFSATDGWTVYDVTQVAD